MGLALAYDTIISRTLFFHSAELKSGSCPISDNSGAGWAAMGLHVCRRLDQLGILLLKLCFCRLLQNGPGRVWRGASAETGTHSLTGG